MRTGALGTAVVALALIVMIAGCGDSDESTTAAAPLTTAEFTKQATEICKDGNKERRELVAADAGGESFSEAEKEELVSSGVDSLNKMIDGLRDLTPPKGDEKEVAAMLDAMEKGTQKLEDDPLAGLESNAMFNKANKLSDEYGLKACYI